MNDGNIDRSPPRVWVVEPYRSGERGQVHALAQALGWPYETKRIEYISYAGRTNLLRGSDLSGIRRASRRRLQAPWPDLLITAGMRNEPVCRWIRKRNAVRTRIVHVGRPWADPSRFDLVVTTPQYRLPQRSNVVQNSLAMHRVNRATLAAAADAWRPKLDGLSPPFLSVILGGDSGPYSFGYHSGRRLSIEVSRLATRLGASVLVTSSARTGDAALESLKAGLEVPHQLYRWQPDDSENPYLAYLGLADELIVTADSVSMLSEACATGRPVHMFDLNCGRLAMRRDRRCAGKNDLHIIPSMYRVLMLLGPRRLSRDITLVHARLIEERRACWLGDPPPPDSGSVPSDLERAVRAVRGLFV